MRFLFLWLRFLTPFSLCTIRYHGGGVCPAGTTGCVYEETTDSTQHIVEVPGGLAVGISPQLLGKRGDFHENLFLAMD